MSCNIRACKGSAWFSCSIFSGSESGSNWYGNIDELAVLARGGAALKHRQLTNHNTFSFSEGGPSSNPELIKPFVPGWGERYCNNVNYVKNNAQLSPSMRVCSSTPPKQNQDFVKGHNRTPLILFIKFKIYILKSVRLVRLKKKTISTFIQLGHIKLIKSVSKDIYKVTKVFFYFI